MQKFLQKEDYEEPQCLLNMHPEIVRVPTRRILDKLDSYLAKKDFDMAQRLLKGWEQEADQGNDLQGKLTILNEEIGLYRKLDKKEECLGAITQAKHTLEKLNFSDTQTGATTYINAATGYKAFGMPNEALPLYIKAREIYEEQLSQTDDRLAALYNNMALTLTELSSYDEAIELYKKAIAILENINGSEPEIAITYLNMADTKSAMLDPVEAERYICDYLDKAEQLLDKEPIPSNANYAYVCEKCAPVFGHFGYFLTQQKLESRAKEIYERT